MASRALIEDARHGIERRRQDDDRGTRHAMRALRGDQRHAEHEQQVAERERRVGRLCDEDDRQRQIDRERVEVEGIAGRNHEADHRILDAETLQLAHHLRQHRVRRGGGDHDHQPARDLDLAGREQALHGLDGDPHAQCDQDHRVDNRHPQVNLQGTQRIERRVVDARPARVRFVTALPKTRSGKMLRRVIQAVCEGRDAGDITTLEDPSALQQIRDLVASA